VAGDPSASETAPACTAGEVTSIFIDNRSIFDVSTIEDERFRWAYRLANSLHIETRPYWLRQQLLFDVGDCPDDFLIQESGRLLREFRFLARADVFAVPQPDGTRHVIVDTQDEWSTQLNLRITLDRGLDIERASLEEQNFLGIGTRLALFYEERRERLNYGAEVAMPNIAASGNDASFAIGRTREGTFVDQLLMHPFRGEVGRVAGRQQFRRRDDLFAYALGTMEGPTHITIPTDEGFAEITLAGRLGEPGRQTLIGGGLSWERMLFPGFPESVGVVEDGNFDERIPADSGAVEELGIQVNPRTATRLNLIIGQRNVNYGRRNGLDNLFGIQDVLLGSDLSFTLGRTIGSIATGGAEPQDDFFAALNVYAGWAGDNWIITTQNRAEGRQVIGDDNGLEDPEDGGGGKDVLLESETYAYFQPQGPGRHTLVGRLHFQGGWDMQTPFQLTLGGRYGIRGYNEDAFPGGQRLVFTLEERLAFRWPAPTLIDSGLTLFGDVGAGWAGGAPFGVDTGIKGSVGIGIRLGFPTGTRSVVRIDLAAPVKSDFSFSDMILRVHMREVLGLLKSFSTPQMMRSRRSGVRTTFTGVQR
jgi:hypothetical protein